MPTRSAGLVVYRPAPGGGVEVLLVHPGGPFWAAKDEGAWSFPKGEHGDDEDALAAAEREFAEELGVAPPAGPRLDLGELRQPSGKRVRLWAVRGDVDTDAVTSNEVELAWPPRTGRTQRFPEVDRASWETVASARTRLHRGLVPFLDRLDALLARRSGAGGPVGEA